LRTAVFSFALALAACGPSAPPPPLPEPPARQTWFICDAIDAPVVLAFAREGSTARVAQYSKPDGAIVQRTEYELGAEEGAAGSIHTALMQNGAEAGAIRQLNPGMLETPASAYTVPFASVQIGEREIDCRWMPRTRLIGFTGRRSIVVHEDQDGDLIYTSYDFAGAAQAQPVELSENARTTSFSLEVRGGEEQAGPEGARYTFRADAETDIVVTAPREGAGTVTVTRHGPDPVQSEDLIAFVEGQGPAR
jgi:hypothetical protein